MGDDRGVVTMTGKLAVVTFVALMIGIGIVFVALPVGWAKVAIGLVFAVVGAAGRLAVWGVPGQRAAKTASVLLGVLFLGLTVNAAILQQLTGRNGFVFIVVGVAAFVAHICLERKVVRRTSRFGREA